MAAEINGLEEMQTEIAGQDDYDLNRVIIFVFYVIFHFV